MSFQWRDSEMRRDIDSAAANKHDHNDNHLRPPPNTSDAASINADTASTITTLSTARMDNKADSPSQHQEQQDLKKDARSRTSTQQNRILEIEKHYRKRRRVNGLQWPLNPLQFVGWATLMGLTVLSFGAFIPALPEDCHFPLFVWCAVIFGAHYLAHFLALAVDPADPGLRGRSSTETVPEFDRNKHSHVIENGRCHLCNITIRSNRSKHCSVCNKCVDRFDHHCKWLNHCIGRRNYKIFLVTVATAILGSLTTMSLCVADITLYLHDRNSLELILIPSTNPLDWALLDDAPASPQNATFRPPVSTNNEVTFIKYFAVMGHPVSQPAFLVSSVVAIVFSGIVVLLLMHLLVFHVYMIKLGITTYEYLRGYHQDHALREAAVASERTAELAEAEALKKNREERLERFKSHWCLGTLFRRQQNKVKDATFSHPNRKKSMMEDPSVLLGSNQSGPRKGSFPRSTTPTKENPWPGRSRIEIPGRLAPIAHEERRNDEFYDENEAPSKNNRRSDQERKNDQSSSHFDQSRQRTKSSVPVLPKINEATPPSTADSDGSARTTFSTEASIEDGPVVSRSSTRQKAKNGLDHGSVVRKDGSGELSKEPSAMPVAVKSRVVNVSERGTVKRGSSSQNDRHVSSAARKPSDQMAPIMETESKWLRRPGTADGQPPSDSFPPDRDDTRTSGRRRRSARGGALKSVDRNVDRVLPFKDPSRSPDDSTDEDDHHLDSPRSRKIMYREIGTVFKDDGVDEEDTPDSSHGEAFFQRRGYWAV